MSIVDNKKKVFGKIAAAKTLTEGLPKLKLSSSFSSVNNNGNSISFLSDLIKSLIGFNALVDAVVDILTHSLTKIEIEIKKALKVELKSIVSCGVDPHLPAWIKSSGNGIVIELSKIDFMDILRTDPNSVGGKLLYNDITSPLTNSPDFNTFLFGVVQDDGITHTWHNIIDVTFNSLGSGSTPNNTLTLKANPSYNNKTLTDLNNDFVDSLTLFKTENIINQILDIIYGAISSSIGKSLKQLENEARINTIIDKMVENVNEQPISDSYFAFTNEEISQHQISASTRKRGLITITTTNPLASTVPTQSLSTLTQEISGATTTIQKKDAITNNLNRMANISASKSKNQSDKNSIKLDFIQQIVNNLIKAIVGTILSPKVITIFVVNYKIIYGPSATFGDGVDFIKKNKNLMHSIMKTISTEIVKILLSIALKEIGQLVALAMLKKQKEKATLKLAQLQSLIGIPSDTIKKILDNLL